MFMDLLTGMKSSGKYILCVAFFVAATTSELMARSLNYERKLEMFPLPKDSTGCRELECSLFIHVIKSRQTLFLYESGVLIDSFKVSTGTRNHPTPDINMRPKGPTFVKYTSRKYPEGNYNGLGNMPYAVFIKDGYALHGTTPGNFLHLGRRASHGCIRLHPDNAKKLYELVNFHGLENTWVKVHE
jgi:hypothetical protein